MKRERYSGTFNLGRDTTAKEMLHCFALAYFAVTPANNRSIDGLIDALCDSDYSKYEAHMEYPLLPTSTLITAAQSKKVLELYDDETSTMKEFQLKMEKAGEAVRILQDKQKIKKLTAKQEKELKDNLKITSDSEKKKSIKKITDEFEKYVQKFSNISSNILRKKLYIFTAYDKDKEKPDEAAESWVKSAYWTAEVLGKKNIIGQYSDYIFAHSSSRTSRFIKEKPLSLVASLTAAVLGIERLKSDMFNPSDIYAIEKHSLHKIIDDYKQVIYTIVTSHSTLNHTPFLKLVTDHIKQKLCIPISLKKSLTPNPPTYLTGTKYGLHGKAGHLYPLVDSYTHILEYLEVKNKANENTQDPLKDKIKKLIKINSIKYKHTIETFDVNFTFNYSDLSKDIPELQGKQIILSDEHYSLTTASMTWNALPTNSAGKTIGAYTGGAGFTQIAAILKKYPSSREIFEQIKTHRKQAYLMAMKNYVDNPSNITIPNILNKDTILNEGADRREIYNSIKKNLKYYDVVSKNVYCLYLIYLNSFLLYGTENKIEIDKIEDMLKDFSKNVSNEKVKGLIATNILRKYGWWGKDKKTLKPPKEKTSINTLNQIKVKEYSKRVYQEDRCAKLEALYFYTEGKGSMSGDHYTIDNKILNEFFKKQITMTIYGLITKKGSKIFLTAPEIKEEKKKNTNLRQVSDALGFRTTPYFLIGNGSDD